MFYNSDVSLLDGNLVESVLIKIATDPKDLNNPAIQIDQYKISDWKQSDKQKRFNKYRQKKIRDRLDNRDGLKENNRNHKYQIMCEYAAHATYPGFKLVAPKKLVKIGPFFDLNYFNPSKYFGYQKVFFFYIANKQIVGDVLNNL